MQHKVNIFWFRRDLRLEDNHGLYAALSGDLPVIPLFIFDKNILDRLEDKKDARVDFIHSEIETLKKAFEKNGSSMIIRYGTPEKVFSELAGNFNIAGVFTNYDHEPYGRERDKEVEDILSSSDIKFESFRDHIVFEPDDVLKDDGKPYTVFTPYKNKWLNHFTDDLLERFPSEEKLENLFKTKPLPSIELKAMGFEKTDTIIPSKKFPVETIEKYNDQRNIPGIKGTSRLGIHLRFGTVSLRELMKQSMEMSMTYVNELIWREFFMMIMWHFPHVVSESFKPKYDRIPWRNNEKEFSAWCQGKTGYPIVDAGMRELNNTGFMHNRVRMITASFLTKHLLIDWRWGESYFAKKLLDYELSSNNGGWQWAAGSGCDAAPYFRIFNPESQTKKFDPDLKYILKWVPELKTEHYPKEIVNHRVARERALSTYKSALQ